MGRKLASIERITALEPIKDKALETKLVALASKAGIEGADIFQVNGSKQSSKINAYVTGMFGSKRIVLYDTMIDNFTHDEILFVMGHEMGHYVKQHIWWGLGLAIAFVMFSLWLTNLLIYRSLIGSKDASNLIAFPISLRYRYY